MVAARQWFVSGRVQGVGFRFFAEEQARRENLHGHVRNLANGCVEVVAEGDDEALVRFERAIRRGPAGARVDACDVTELQPTGRATGFSIRA